MSSYMRDFTELRGKDFDSDYIVRHRMRIGRGRVMAEALLDGSKLVAEDVDVVRSGVIRESETTSYMVEGADC